MNKFSFFKSLIHLNKSKSDKGFTLIELLIVIIILGILATISLSNTIKQTAKAREAEGKNNLGLLIRTQQVYHFEVGTFANSMSILEGIVSFQSKYYTFPDPIVTGNSRVKHQVNALNPTVNQTRNYAGGVYFDSGVFNVAVCESSNVDVVVNVPDTITDSCTNSGTRIR